MNISDKFDQPILYRIKVKGLLDPKWANWFGGFTITHTGNETVLVGVTMDQASLHGVIAKIRDLGLELILIQQVEADA